MRVMSDAIAKCVLKAQVESKAVTGVLKMIMFSAGMAHSSLAQAQPL